MNANFAIGLLTLTALAILLPIQSALATPYNNPGPFVMPFPVPSAVIGPPAAAHVPGKELSYDTAGPTTLTVAAASAVDPEQVTDWDGWGGTADGLDYTSVQFGGRQIDALANFYDTLILPLLDNQVHLVFSVDQSTTQPVLAGGVTLSGGQTIGGAGELSYELAGPQTPASQAVWATSAEINADGPADVDAVELWGPEPSPGLAGDANKFSLESDYDSYDAVLPGDAVSVWNANGTPFLRQSMVVGLVTSLLGTSASISPQDLPALVDVDALMVQNMPGASPNVFDAITPYGPDVIVFSIRQIADGSGYYATGSELFVMYGDGTGGFLSHGGHLWDRNYALTSLGFDMGNGLTGVIDIDALEAVAAPEPSGLLLILLATICLGARRRCQRVSA